jgi:hypothetical protein
VFKKRALVYVREKLTRLIHFFTTKSSNTTKTVYVDYSPAINQELIDSIVTAAKTPTTAILTTPTSTLLTDTSLADVFTVTLTQSVTMTCSGGIDGKGTTWLITQGSGGGKIVTLDSGFVLPSSASELSWSTVAGKTDILAARYSSTLNKWLVVSFVPGY